MPDLNVAPSSCRPAHRNRQHRLGTDTPPSKITGLSSPHGRSALLDFGLNLTTATLAQLTRVRELRLFTAIGVLAAGLLWGLPAAAESDFISLYLAAQGGCANTAISPLSFVLSGPDQQAPFGKPAEKWTGEDLAALKMALAACQAAAAQAGSPYTSQEVRQESEDVLTRVPQIVARAKAQAEARLQQIEARRQIANARIDRAVQAKQQAKASAETEATRLEREADAVEAEARDAQQRLDQRILRATHTRNEANARSA